MRMRLATGSGNGVYAWTLAAIPSIDSGSLFSELAEVKELACEWPVGCLMFSSKATVPEGPLPRRWDLPGSLGAYLSTWLDSADRAIGMNSPILRSLAQWAENSNRVTTTPPSESKCLTPILFL